MRANDRCDRCNAQAFVMTLHNGLPMYWCSHHYTQFEVWLAPFVYVDDRELLQA